MKTIMTTTVIVLAFALCPMAYAHDQENNMASMQSSPRVAKAPFDIQFLDTMSEHHRMGIEMMELAVKKARNDKIKSDAQEMIDNQQNEIKEMQALKKQIDPNAAVAINMNLPGMMHMDMKKLDETSGMSFDRAYLQSMIMHHQGAIKMSDLALKQAKNSDVKEKAQIMHDMQKKEIADMQHMLAEMK